LDNIFTKLLSKFPKSLLGIGEQGLHSAYSFIVVAVAGRTLTQNDFGMFTLMWAAYPIVLLLFSSAFTIPLSISYPAANKEDQANLKYFCNLLRKICLAVFTFFFVCLIPFYYFDLSTLLILVFIGTAIMSIRMEHETVRRLYLADNRHENTVFHTVVMLLPGIIVLPLLFIFQKNLLTEGEFDRFGLIILSCLAVPSLLLFLFKPRETKANAVNAWHSLFNYGKPLLLAAAIETAFKRLSPYLMTISAGVAEAGVWAAARTVIGPAQVILLGVMNTALPAMRRAYSEQGYVGLNGELKKYSLLLFTLYLVPLIVLATFSDIAIRVLIGVSYPGAGETLIIYCAAFSVMGFNSLSSNYLQAVAFVKQQVIISTLSSLIYLLGMIYIVSNGVGSVGIAYLSFISEIITAFFYFFYIAILKKEMVDNF
jgi:O-antigen/teichoic acid export membrane protein